MKVMRSSKLFTSSRFLLSFFSKELFFVSLRKMFNKNLSISDKTFLPTLKDCNKFN